MRVLAHVEMLSVLYFTPRFGEKGLFLFSATTNKRLRMQRLKAMKYGL